MTSTKTLAALAVVGLCLPAGQAAAQNLQRALLPSGPSQDVQLGNAANTMGALNSTLLRGEPQRGGAGAVDVASRAPTLGFGGLLPSMNDTQVSFSSQGSGSVVLVPWVELSGLQSEDSLRRYTATVLELGLDGEMTPELTLGASVAFVQSDVESVLDFSNDTAEATGQVLTLSALYERGGWHADAALRFGRYDYDQVLLGTAGSAESDATVLRVSLGYDVELGTGGTITPTLAYLTGREEITGTGGGLAGAGTREVTFSETSIGAVYSHEISGMGSVSFGLFSDNFSLDGDAGPVLIGSDREGQSGRVELGLDLGMSEMADISVGVSYGGIGSDMETVQGALGVSFRF
ncbi:autotransporter outer membrane beta-barrel domain-containing protein [Gymnodinialimonas hymeniacidonis]|uniref:autotransporter outer membrane beta-barrel domain-containing protein n=1 Tax=Gymnodinialimonas hymeniacidonis TaxID=3126508 RepID=UPI0034C67866